MSSKSTISSNPWLSVSCTSAIDPTRRTASSSAALASSPCDPPRLQAQQRRHRLEVVLHPVVDLADRRVLGEQLALAAAQLGDVAQQQQRAGALALGERDGAHDSVPLAVPTSVRAGPVRRPRR